MAAPRSDSQRKMPAKHALSSALPKRAYVKAEHAPKPLAIAIDVSPAIDAQLKQLQQAFADVCNAIAPTVRETRCWNRVALHHLVYHSLRARFPQLGSQMICNAIYSVSRNCRMIFQSPGSPFNVARLGNRPLPQIQFAPEAPVYFDRHTLSIRNGIVSLLTLDGRVRFQLNISESDEQRFRLEKLREILLLSHAGQYQLRFVFASVARASSGASARATAAEAAELPKYVVLLDERATDQVTELGEVA